MKRTFFTICVVCAIASLSSCRSAKEVATVSDINGEWSIVEINGSEVVLSEGQEYPFIGFESTTGKVYGNSGCNRIMGSFDTNAKPGSLDMGALASTRMMCPNMTLENNVLNALKNVKGYKKMGENIALTNSSNRPVVILTHKIVVSKTASLEGEWKIVEVNGEAVPSDLEKKPFLNFDVNKKRVHGNAGCNMINGVFMTKEDNQTAISFPPMAATMMACPDMTLEKKILKALTEVKTFDLNNKSVGLYSENGTLVLKLAK
ncbi:META domain-containing protein [Bacteroides sp. 224]|uniref:META domain-containing protein n=1 Tax=Bacteroides sp. 224 TaxID=2302936 RepID=UPI001D85071C|nr:META domain-containing protein [Bacteroides sp. 224]